VAGDDWEKPGGDSRINARTRAVTRAALLISERDRQNTLRELSIKPPE
jgi:hypothetical protein